MKICPSCKQQYPDALNLCPQDKEVLEEDLQALVGTTLDGQYFIEAMLGQGGMGAVFRARHALLGDIVAIKVMPSSISQNSEYQRRFLREGKAARLFQHPNVVAVHDLRQTTDGRLYMVLEYIEGRSLHSELKQRKRFSPQEAYNILAPIGEALGRAHQAGVIHRDLKPDNIMVGQDSAGQPVAKLLDLGIAKIQDVEATALTVDGQLLGTPYYMSPEQWNGSEIDHRADIYSLAVVFYELISGKRPFEGRTLENLALQHLMNVPPPLMEIAPDTPPPFSNVIARALAKKPEDRPADCQQLLAELKNALVGKEDAASVGDAATLVAVENEESGARSGWWNSLKAAVPTMRSAPARQTNPQAQETQKTTSYLRNQDDPANLRSSDAEANAIFDAATVKGTQPFLSASGNNVIPSSAPALNNKHLEGHQRPEGAALAKNEGSATIANAEVGRSSRWLLVVVGLVLVIVGYFWLKPAPLESVKPVTATAGDSATPADSASVEVAEVIRYWVESYPTEGSPAVRQADGKKIAPGTLFRFGFQARQPGYLYIFGPNPAGQMVGFLTANLPPDFTKQYGVTTNALNSQAEFHFPTPLADQDNGLSLDKQVTENRFTVIWSPRPLTNLAATQLTPGTALTTAQLAQLQQFLKQLRPASGEQITSPLANTVVKRRVKDLDTPCWFEILVGAP